MAENTKREAILERLKAELEELDSIVMVARVRLSFADLGNLANTQLPYIAMVGKLPKPEEKWSQRTQGQPDKFTSRLTCQLYVYALAYSDPDTIVSVLADDIWVKIYATPTMGFKYVLGIDLDPNVEVGHFDPYVIFRIDAHIKYVHTTGGI